MNGDSDRDLFFSKTVKAGKRIYYFDVKQSRNGDKYVAITESKRIAEGPVENPHVTYEKHKLFLYKEDYEKLQMVQQAIKSINGYLQALSNAQGSRKAIRLPQVLVVAVDRGLLRANGLSDDNDNMVLSAALAYKENNPVLITSDYGLQNIAIGKGSDVNFI